MSEPMTSQQKHGATLSVDSNASGIEGSTISFATVSQFPQPPLSIPTPTTPTGSQFLTSEFPAHLKDRLTAVGAQPHGSTPPSPAYLKELPSYLKDRADYDAPSSASSLITRFRPQDFPTEVSSPSSQDDAQFLPRYPLPPIPNATPKPSRSPSVKTAISLSPYDWHEGSSTIDEVDPTEERLLSTSFITSLLSSERGSPRSTLPGTPRRQHPFAGDDGASTISEVSYPAITSPHEYPPRFQGPGASYWDEGRSSPGSNHTHGDSVNSFVEHTHPAVVRMASMSRVGPRGASVVGVAPAVRMLSTTSSSFSDPPSTIRSTLPLLHGFQTSQAIQEDFTGEQKFDTDISQTKRSTMASTAPSPYRRRQSTQSSKSAVSSLIARMSKNTGRAFRRIKPLPAVPLISDMHRSEEAAHRKHEEGLPLPHLASRADTLVGMLNNGHRPHTSTDINPWDAPYGVKGELGATDSMAWNEQPTTPQSKTYSRSIWNWSRDTRPQRFVPVGDAQGTPASLRPRSTKGFSITRFGRFRVILVAAILLVIIIVAVVIGVVVGHKKHTPALPNCPGNSTGSACDLDATCVCPSSSSDICIAQSLISLTPTVNQLFNANLSTHTVATALWNTQGAPVNKNCAYQAILVDVGSALSAATFPNRTAWARSALLWQLVQTADLSTVSDLQSFVSGSDFSSFTQDGPIEDPSLKFNSTSAGFNFDFAAQTVTQPAVTWENIGQPSSAQISEVSDIASKALDRMYTFAVASSTQQQEALSQYWQFSLQQSPKDLSKFRSIVSGSPIMIPFDASVTSGNSPVEALLLNTTTQFPPPIACYPSLNSNQLNRVNQVENGVFGLSPASVQAGFQLSCYGDRPVYGILDVLRLRLPFSDSRNNVAREGAMLKRAASPRAVIYSGEIISAFPHDPSNASFSLDPRQYGTLNNFDHVMLQYLTSIADINVAIAFVKFVLSSPALPPTNSSNLFTSLSSLPPLEVAVFGNVTGSDVDYVVSSFSSPTNDLFFGSDASLALRNWAITGIQSSVEWAVSSTSPEVVHDSSFDDSLFNAVWNPAFQYMHESDPGVTVNVNNISSSFQSIGKFSP